jgi:hypothetical protein
MTARRRRVPSLYTAEGSTLWRLEGSRGAGERLRRQPRAGLTRDGRDEAHVPAPAQGPAPRHTHPPRTHAGTYGAV